MMILRRGRRVVEAFGRYFSDDPVIYASLVSILFAYLLYFELGHYVYMAAVLACLNTFLMILSRRDLKILFIFLFFIFATTIRFSYDNSRYGEVSDRFEMMVNRAYESNVFVDWVVEGRIDGHGRSIYVLKQSEDRSNFRIRATVRGFTRYPVGSRCKLADNSFEVRGYTDPEISRSIERYLRSKNLLMSIYIDRIECFGVDRSIPSVILASISKGKRYIERLIHRGLVEPKATLMLGMIFGDDREYETELEEGIRVLGLSHIVAASGSNVNFLERSIERILGNFLPVRLRLILTIVILFIFALVAGVSGSVLRAVASKSVKMIARCKGYSVSDGRALILSILLLLFYRPGLIDDVGFQLSIAAVIGLMVGGWVFGRLSQLVHRSFLGKFVRLGNEFIMPSVVCALFTIPISYLRFGTASLLTIVPNILILPLIDQIFTLGIIAVVLSAFWSPTSMLPEVIWRSLDLLLSFFLSFINLGSDLMSRIGSSQGEGVFVISVIVILIMSIYVLLSSNNYYLNKNNL